MKDNKYTLEIGGKNLMLELRNLAEQANGSVVVKYGDTMVMSNCVMSKQDKENLDFFPLTVEYEEKYYAAGKISGSRFIKREARPSDEAICNARLIDRAIRPRFGERFAREVQVVNTVLCWDGENDPDIIGMLAASVSLSISDIPWDGPISAVRVIKKDGKFILNPTYIERENRDMEIVFSGVIENNEVMTNMIECAGDEIDEQSIFDAFEFAQGELQKLIDFQKQVVKEMGKPKAEVKQGVSEPEFEEVVNGFINEKLEKALFQKEKEKRVEETEKVKTELLEFLKEKYPEEEKDKVALFLFDKAIDRVIHDNAINHEKRVDGRKIDELRDIYCEVGLLPRTHGSGLFFRGQTKSLSILTLGAPGDQQLLESMETTDKKRFMHHYNFPPYSTGEVKPMRGPGRREIGHGMLAEKAILPLLPKYEDFPYTIRVVSEMLSSNGSTSQASICSTSLALMDAGVPIKRPAAGIAIGLMQDQKSREYKVLTDIQGPEDHHGDMDFKVAGTRNGVTAIQMDIKIGGISKEIIKEALERAKKARYQILDKIEAVLPNARPNLSPYAPRIEKMQIDPDKIREVIGPGGKMINEIIAQTGTAIDIEDSGLVFVTGSKEEGVKKAMDWIKAITKEVEVGEEYEGKVKRILDFGAFVEILPGQEGMIHISKLAPTHVKRVEDVVNLGDSVTVKVIAIDDQGRINLGLIKNNSAKNNLLS